MKTWRDSFNNTFSFTSSSFSTLCLLFLQSSSRLTTDFSVHTHSTHHLFLFVPSRSFLPQAYNITSLVLEREKKHLLMLKLHDKRWTHKGGSVPFQESARHKIHFAKFRGQYQGQGTLPSFKVPFSLVALKKRDHCHS